FHPTEHLTLKANVSSGFTAPNYAQLGVYGKHEGTYRFEAGNTHLEVEQNLQGDLGIILENKNIDVHLEDFYNKITGYIYLANTGGVKEVSIGGVDSLLPFYDYRQDDATIKGAELMLDIHPEKVQWIDLILSYGMLKAELDNGGNLPYIPADKFVAALRLKKAKMNYVYNPYISFVLSNYFEQSEVASFEMKSEGYSLLDLHLGGSFKWGQQFFDISVSANNLMNTGYFNHLSLIRSIGVRDMGRNVCIHLHVPFGIKTRK
ncbi:MAG: TonB-dependent receptor, partial [Bacteroidia bacterium]|nr:TonB-dependent receptor [Bacteroidia bacterium]